MGRGPQREGAPDGEHGGAGLEGGTDGPFCESQRGAMAITSPRNYGPKVAGVVVREPDADRLWFALDQSTQPLVKLPVG